MNRSLLLIIIFCASVFGFSSCKKCYTCNFGGGDVRTYCSQDNPDGVKGLNLTIKAYEAQGYTCTAN